MEREHWSYLLGCHGERDGFCFSQDYWAPTQLPVFILFHLPVGMNISLFIMNRSLLREAPTLAGSNSLVLMKACKNFQESEWNPLFCIITFW